MEALGPLSKRKGKLLADHDELKIKLDQQYENLAEQKRSYQQEVEALSKMTFKIKE